MRTIVIPSDRNPYEIEIDGVKYSYPAGSTQDVPDEVAELIEHNQYNHKDPNAGETPAVRITREIAELREEIAELKTQIIPVVSFNVEEGAVTGSHTPAEVKAYIDSGRDVIALIKCDSGNSEANFVTVNDVYGLIVVPNNTVIGNMIFESQDGWGLEV
ncbi:MAG: hypothetical protein IJS22_03405 [Lachnospiraceae bacterium]|nr:hypothetical protein [Lachnospiraceae bacterium]